MTRDMSLEEELRLTTEFRDSWVRSWASTEPVDRAAVENAVRTIYKRKHLLPPSFVWVDSPVAATNTSLKIFDDMRLTVWNALKNGLGEGTGLAFERERRRNVVDDRPRTWSDMFLYAQHEGIFVAAGMPIDRYGIHFPYARGPALRAGFGGVAAGHFIDVAMLIYERDVFGSAVGFDDEFLKAHEVLARSLWYWWPFKGVCMLCERPQTIRLEQDRFHSLSDAAIEFRDGWKVYAVRGTIVPPNWVTATKDIPFETAFTWPNIEQRRIAADLIGWNKVLEHVGAVVVDENQNPSIGTLLRATLPETGEELFLRVQCGTGRTFAIPVPRHMRTALEANAWTYDISEEQLLKLEVRT